MLYMDKCSILVIEVNDAKQRVVGLVRADRAVDFELGVLWTLYAYVILILPFDRIMEGRVRLTLFFH